MNLNNTEKMSFGDVEMTKPISPYYGDHRRPPVNEEERSLLYKMASNLNEKIMKIPNPPIDWVHTRNYLHDRASLPPLIK